MIKMRKRFAIQMLYMVAAVSVAEADITGTVFRDLPVNGTTLNTYGVKDANELGVEGVTVTAFAADATQAAIATTTADGTYTLNTGAGDYRVEFSDWPEYLKESPDATGSKTSVQFVKDGTNDANMGLHNPSDFSSTENPDLATTVFIVGDRTDTNGPQNTIVTATYQAGASNETNVTKDQTGSVWGLAYDPDRKLLYSASMLRRHSDLGPDGLGAVYVTDYETNTTQLFVNVANDESVGSITRGADDIKAYNKPTHDPDAFAKIGKVGLGDIDITPDGKSLFVTNLNTKNILEYDVASKSLKQTYRLPNNVCAVGELRPFALKYHNGTLYSGSVCDNNDSTHNMTAHVFKWNGNNFESVANADLGYDKEPARKTGKPSSCPTGWLSWVDTPPKYCDTRERDLDGDGTKETVYYVIYPQPMLTDIEFDTNENMILGFSDRSSFQWGSQNYSPDINDNEIYVNMLGGDILRATLDASGSYSVESPTYINGDETNSTEFFGGEEYITKTNKGHHETSEGGLAVLKGSDEVVLSAMDPEDWNQGGLIWLSTKKGDQNRHFMLTEGATPQGYNGKSGGIGDVELLLDPAPIEIGNRVWLDANGNGVQDPDEMPLSGVTVQLLNANGVVIAEVNTSKEGTYIFSNDPMGTDNLSNGYDYNITQLDPNKEYTVRIPNISGDHKQTALNDYVLTVADVNATVAGANLHDSDGSPIDHTNADAAVDPTDIPLAGANNHSFDFGFSPSVSLGSVIWYDENDNGIQDANETGIDGLTVELLDANGDPVLDDQGQPITMITHDGGKYYFDHLQPGTYRIRVSGGTIDQYQPSSVQNTNADDNDATDSNIESGDATHGYVSAPVTLTPGKEPTGDAEKSQLPNNGDDQDDTDNTNGNMTLDMGFVLPPEAADGSSAPTPPSNQGAGSNGTSSSACTCKNASIKANGGDALGIWGMFMMLLITLGMGLYFVREKEERGNVL